MKHIILEANNTDAVVFDIRDLETRFAQLTDKRAARGKIYPLSMILTMVILAKLSGEDKPSGITDWIRLRCESFVKLFNAKHQRMPCLNIIRRVLQEIGFCWRSLINALLTLIGLNVSRFEGQTGYHLPQ